MLYVINNVCISVCLLIRSFFFVLKNSFMNRTWPFYKKFVFLFIAVYIFLYANATQFIATFAFMPVWKKTGSHICKSCWKHSRNKKCYEWQRGYEFWLLSDFTFCVFVYNCEYYYFNIRQKKRKIQYNLKVVLDNSALLFSFSND